MRSENTPVGLRVLIAAGAMALLGFCAGAAVPDSASADGSSGGNQNYCYPGTKSTMTMNGVLVQTCTITASSGTCIQRSSAPKVEQHCTFTQTSSMASVKRAVAIQIHDPEGFDGEQDGTQVIDVTQDNTSSKNLLDAAQIADQCLGAGDRYEDHDGDRYDEDHDGDRDDDGRCEDEDEEDNEAEERSEDKLGLLLLSTITQSQEAHQSIDGDQTASGTGRNESKAFQSQHLHQRAANAPAINQSQNVANQDDECNPLLVFGFTNACYTIDQNAVNGPNISRLLQVYKLLQSARDTLMGFHRQGASDPRDGGLNHGFVQLNTGTAPAGTPIQTSAHKERMTQRRDDTGTMTWYQHGPLRKDVGMQSAISGGSGATANINQDSVLSSTGGNLTLGHQTDQLQIQCSSTGNCTGFQHAKTNDGEATDTASGSSIFMVMVCGDLSEPEPGGPAPCAPVGDF